MKEKFTKLSINGISTDYLISNYGRVLTKNGESIKRTQINHGGYEKVALQINKKNKLVSVHRAVYESFVGQIPEGMQINHKDGNKLNNRINNLEVVTGSENMQHAWKTGLCKKQNRKGQLNPNYRTGVNNPNSKHTSEEAISVYAMLAGTKLSHKDIAQMLNVEVAFVDDIASGAWGDITNYSKEEVKRNYCFSKKEEKILWYLYREGYRTKELSKILGISKDCINNKLTYIRRNKMEKMDKKITNPKIEKMVNKLLGKDNYKYYDGPEKDYLTVEIKE